MSDGTAAARDAQIYTHQQFLQDFAPDMTDATRVRDGQRLMLSMYGNAKIMF